MALEQWYVHVRQPFFNNQEFGDLLYDGLIDKLSLAKAERIKRLMINGKDCFAKGAYDKAERALIFVST